MKFKKKNEAIQKAVVIIENLIEVTAKDEESEASLQLKEAKRLLTEAQQNKSVDMDAVKIALDFFKYVLVVFFNNS